VRPAGGRGGPECRQHERGVVHHRDLRDVHRGEVLRRPAAASCCCFCCCSRCSLRTRAIPCLQTLRVPVRRPPGEPRRWDEGCQQATSTGGDKKRQPVSGKASPAGSRGGAQ
jgi:hypothetical protein